jgi:hypothetical protein
MRQTERDRQTDREGGRDLSRVEGIHDHDCQDDTKEITKKPSKEIGFGKGFGFGIDRIDLRSHSIISEQ